MTPSFKYTDDGRYFIPVIIHADGKYEVLHGPPLINMKTALKYARLEIDERRAR